MAAYSDLHGVTVWRGGTDSLYRGMARLGTADTQARAGQFDAALATWKELASSTDADLPKDAILMELAETYEAAGRGSCDWPTSTRGCKALTRGRS